MNAVTFAAKAEIFLNVPRTDASDHYAMKKLFFALALFAGFAAFAPQAEAGSKRHRHCNSDDRYYYEGGYGGPAYRGYNRVYYAPAPVYYAPAPVYYAPRYYDSCRPRYYSRPRVAVSFGF